MSKLSQVVVFFDSFFFLVARHRLGVDLGPPLLFEFPFSRCAPVYNDNLLLSPSSRPLIGSGELRAFIFLFKLG